MVLPLVVLPLVVLPLVVLPLLPVVERRSLHPRMRGEPQICDARRALRVCMGSRPSVRSGAVMATGAKYVKQDNVTIMQS